DAAVVSQAEIYTYYANGTMKTKTDRNGNTTSYTYDIHGNLLTETAGSDRITYTYDPKGNMLTMTDATGKTTRTYDELGRVLTKKVPHVGTISFEYDNTADTDPGCYREIATDSKGNSTVKVYDKAGRLSKVIAGNDITAYTYYDNGNRAGVTYNDGSKEEYTYYANNQVETLVNKKADGSVMDSYSYIYDNNGNQLTKQEVINGLEKGTTIYTYDTLNRLLTVTETNGRVTAYEYDKAGNRSKETIVITDSTANSTITTENTYAYNNQNRLTDINTKVNNVLTGITSYTYDKNGNQLTTVVKTYKDGAVTSTVTTEYNTYDLHNQLIQTVTEDGTAVNNSYNAEGYRVGKEVNGDKTYYLYEADKIILEVDEAGNQTARNVYGTNLIRRTIDGETYYYMYNGHADVTALITGEGTIAATYYYDAFGNILESTGEVDNNILYSGYQYDKETGLYYLNTRMYDPKTARFLQEDTYTGNPNDPLSLNLYTYCSNNPVIYWDPTGHSWKDITNFFKTAASKAGKRAKAVGNSVTQSVKAVGKNVKTFGNQTANLVKSTFEQTMNMVDLGIGWQL
ncbi:MAG: RHS repeat-associated core domain-containing protein, partial [Anaerocolumna sp.]